MATLTDDQLLQIIKSNPNKKLIEFGKDQHKTARLHFYGVGLEDHLPQIKGFEDSMMADLRLKYALSNKDLFARLYKPIKKVFTARGGSSYYNLGDELNAQAVSLEKMVRRGFTCKKWVESNWCRHAIDDPMGVIFIEIDKNGKAYPTYKTIDNIFDYQLSGTGLDWIVWKLTADQRKDVPGLKPEDVVFRVVDDVEDKYVKLTDGGNRLEVVMEFSYINYFQFVPAIINSFIPNPDGDGFISFFDSVFDLADLFLTETSIKITNMFRHGFPKYFEFADDCVECRGTGKLNGVYHKDCLGTGKRVMFKPSDVKALEYPTKDNPLPASFVPGGYIQPSKIFYEIISQELEGIEQKIQKTIWDAKPTTKLQSGMGLSSSPNGTVTATEVMDNRQPQLDQLNEIADAAESRDKFIMDCLITINLDQPTYIDEGGCSKNYGRRYLIEEPDALLQKYRDARKENISATLLYDLYDQYLEAKYQSDPESLNLKKKLMKVEPFMHYTLSELKLNGATPEDIRLKQYYGDWLVSLSSDFLFSASVQELIANRDKFVALKPLPVVEPTESTSITERMSQN